MLCSFYVGSYYASFFLCLFFLFEWGSTALSPMFYSFTILFFQYFALSTIGIFYYFDNSTFNFFDASFVRCLLLHHAVRIQRSKIYGNIQFFFLTFWPSCPGSFWSTSGSWSTGPTFSSWWTFRSTYRVILNFFIIELQYLYSVEKPAWMSKSIMPQYDLLRSFHWDLNWDTMLDT